MDVQQQETTYFCERLPLLFNTLAARTTLSLLAAIFKIIHTGAEGCYITLGQMWTWGEMERVVFESQWMFTSCAIIVTFVRI